jgi:hypothetical protein
LPRYLLMVLALAGDSTTTTWVLIIRRYRGGDSKNHLNNAWGGG